MCHTGEKRAATVVARSKTVEMISFCFFLFCFFFLNTGEKRAATVVARSKTVEMISFSRALLSEYITQQVPTVANFFTYHW